MKKRLLGIIVGIVIAGAAVTVGLCYTEYRRFFPICPSYHFFHLYCPGCGSTRALYCLMHGNLVGFFRNNVMLLPTLTVIGLLLFMPGFRKHHVFLNCFTVLLILYAICRNIPVYPFTLLAPAGI